MLLRKTPLSKKLTSEEVEKKLRDVVSHAYADFQQHLLVGSEVLQLKLILCHLKALKLKMLNI